MTGQEQTRLLSEMMLGYVRRKDCGRDRLLHCSSFY